MIQSEVRIKSGVDRSVSWPPCTRCARSLIQAGVTEVIYPAGCDVPERWMRDFDMSQRMMQEAGVQVRPV